jgi:hypothetical protein
MIKKTAAIITIIFIFLNGINAEEKAVEKNNLKPSFSKVEKKEEFISEKKVEEPNISFGLVGTFGTQFPVVLYGPIKFEPGISYGGGFVLEKMFTSRIGIHTGIYFTESISPFTMNFFSNPDSSIMRMGSITIPVYFIGSFNKSFFSLQMLAGVTLTQILYSITSPNPPLATGNASSEAVYQLSQFMAGPGVGLNFKFRGSKYFDLYFGFISTFYFQNFLPRSPDTYVFFYDVKLTAGFMFRTNLFPKPEDWRWK